MKYDEQLCADQEQFSMMLSRRGFLHGLGALSLAGMVPSWLATSAEAAVGRDVPRGARRLAGALYHPYHCPTDWHTLTEQIPEGMPLLGSYSSRAVGSISTQITWARQMGLEFFLAYYSRDLESDGIDALLEAAVRSEFRVALYADLRRIGGWGEASTVLAEIESKYAEHPAYLRSHSGQPVFAIVASGNLVPDVMAALAARPGPVLHLPGEWCRGAKKRWSGRLTEAIDQGDLALGFSPTTRPAPVARSVAVYGEPASAKLVSPVRDDEHGLRLPRGLRELEGGGTDYLILDSFNHWGTSVPLEPGTRSGLKYLRQVADWLSGAA